jgi:hypothetical protein
VVQQQSASSQADLHLTFIDPPAASYGSEGSSSPVAHSISRTCVRILLARARIPRRDAGDVARASCRCARAISSPRTRRSVQSVHVTPARHPASTERHPPHRPLEARQLPAGMACVRAFVASGVLTGGLVAALSRGGFAADWFLFSLPMAVV